MKRLPAKMKITLWYAVIILLITVGPMAVLMFTAEKISWNRAEGNLKDSLNEFMEDVSITSEGYELDEDTEFYDDGISFSIYDSGGRLIEGNVPGYFPEDTVLKSGEVQTIQSRGRKWIVYDEACRNENNDILWFRAAASGGDLSMMGQVLFILMMLLIPVLAVLAVAGGYFITGRTLKPVEDALERERIFTSDVSHELRTPVTVITSESEFALMPEATREEMKESLTVILKQSHRMSELIEQLLILARGESGVQKPVMKLEDISTLAQMTAEQLEGKAEAANIRIITDICPGLYVNGNAESLIRLFINLIENSIRYGRDNGFVKISLVREGELIRGTIEDNGIGMKEEDLKHIWERFYRAETSRTKDGQQGFGLGLPMVQWIVKVHGGRITVKSRPERGTSFIFWLPGVQA